jgi:hypothetical protein
MAPVAARHARHEPRLLRGPVLFRRSRRAVAEIVGCVWLAVQVARLVQRRVAQHRVAAGA